MGITSALPGKTFAIVNDPAGFPAMRAVCEADGLIVFNLGFEPLKLSDGIVVSPAGFKVIDKQETNCSSRY